MAQTMDRRRQLSWAYSSAWGKNFSAFNYFLFDYLPFYNKFRAPSMAMVIPQLTFPFCSPALGLNEIFSKQHLIKEEYSGKI